MKETLSALQMDLPIDLQREGPVPLYQQLGDALRQTIREGRLSAGTRLPSIRSIASALDVSHTVVIAAYDDLAAEGYVEPRHGSGVYVAIDLPTFPLPSALPQSNPRWLQPLTIPPVPSSQSHDLINFRLGQPSGEFLPRRIWHRIWSNVVRLPPPSDYGHPTGDPALQSAVARYLGRMRGLACSREDVIITSSANEALDLVARLTLRPGNRVAFEEPGYPSARQILAGRGAQFVPVPIDTDGIRVDRLPVGPWAPSLVYVTPSHQYPLGFRMAVARRLALLDWARANDALIVENDYDSEFRFDGPPLPALAGLDRSHHVAYIGTFSKVLSPAIRVGYLVVPHVLLEGIRRLKYWTEYHTPWIMQLAMAEILDQGHLDRHIRRMRRIYAKKREMLRTSLAPVAAHARLCGLEAGLHAYMELDRSIDATVVVERARTAGVVVTPLGGYYLGQPDRHGLLIGYGSNSFEQIRIGATILCDVIRTSY